ncbi:MAG: 50S ribosomal protein L3 [Patescibacteria group bacterium]|nr:50S ribosomal protein L3 [Patescibacteria group bacterium]
MLNTLYGIKTGQTQKFTGEGVRVPVTFISMEPNTVVQVKNAEKDGYWALQLGFGKPRISTNKTILGHFKKAGIKEISRFLQEAQVSDVENEKPEAGQIITMDKVFKAGDAVKITGVSKGKGFAGVVKRHHFHGGPKTHGQSDRWRAPGSVGSTTTPGRVLKGKRMAGHLGNVSVTVKGLKVFGLDSEKNLLLVKGLVPGATGTVVKVTKE